MTGVLSDEARAALLAGRLAHLVTVNADGSPQLSAVWVGLLSAPLVPHSPAAARAEGPHQGDRWSPSGAVLRHWPRQGIAPTLVAW